MDKIFEQLTKIEKYARESEVSFASEIEKTNIVASDKLRILREIRKEVSSIISDLTSKVSPLEKQIADLKSDIATKQSIPDKILVGLEEAQDKASRELEDKNKLAAELEVKLDRLQKIISSYISEKDAVAEGVPSDHDYPLTETFWCPTCYGEGTHPALGNNYGVTEVDCSECDTAKKRYANLWNHINGPGSWNTNPWVVAITRIS